MIEEEVPFGARGVHERSQVLSAMIESVDAAGSAGRSAEARDTIGHFYSRLCSTWERFIEADMLGGVVQRLERDVRPGLFYQIAVSADIEANVNDGYTRCSSVIEAHDHPPAAGSQLPSIADMKEDLALLDKTRQLVREEHATDGSECAWSSAARWCGSAGSCSGRK